MTALLLVLKVATLLRKSDQVREDHTAKTDVIEGFSRASLDVLSMIVVQSPLEGVLKVINSQHRLELGRNLLHLHSPQFVEQIPHRHYCLCSFL